jgi:hypothetical protein
MELSRWELIGLRLARQDIRVYLILPSDALDRTLRHDCTGRVRTSTNLRLSADAAPVASRNASPYIIAVPVVKTPTCEVPGAFVFNNWSCLEVSSSSRLTTPVTLPPGRA